VKNAAIGMALADGAGTRLCGKACGGMGANLRKCRHTDG